MQLIVSAGIIAAVVLWGLVSPRTLDSVFSTLLSDITKSFGWFYLWVVLGLVALAFFLAVSRYGNLKLGDEDDEPQPPLTIAEGLDFPDGIGIRPSAP